MTYKLKRMYRKQPWPVLRHFCNLPGWIEYSDKKHLNFLGLQTEIQTQVLLNMSTCSVVLQEAETDKKTIMV
jgi:hypothetical protein